MRDLFTLTIHPLVTWMKLLRRVRAVAAESLLCKHQMLLSNRLRRRAPNLTTLDRFVLGLTTLFIRPHQISTLSVLPPLTVVGSGKARFDSEVWARIQLPQ
jgi:hypothetical protein